MNGLSICIPVFNFNCIESVKELSKQLETHNINAEILVIDDASSVMLTELAKFITPIYRYEKLAKNIGRAKIRNRLAEKAKFDNILFIDGDSSIPKKFIKNYCLAIENYPNQIICGGTIHHPPNNQKTRLRYNYGVRFEYKKVFIRNQASYHNFRPNNFIIKKNLLKQIPFNEKINKYGHEDTFFAYELKKNNIKIIHIDNPVIHLDSDTNDEYITKTKHSIENLILLKTQYPGFISFSNLLSFVSKFKFLQFKIVKKTSSYLSKLFEIITKKTSNSYVFQLFKFFYLISISE
ncbi:glycosyltransferase family 2 protein [Flaviramulus sp. BrNp1-15]|uniref:glycosyltransferase family 2 protein n=1 Tax=Flaviramulus sp. BrNp1-15 TaxID=2916754 RepID=UPI001EE78B77|nr:glycosyltransferase family A protein [Flaviramulus sp. BrNp1-15]ULC58995.1 glycosyltransferase family 2 protein [Flaviramulus sp. BrNp1-15]